VTDLPVHPALGGPLDAEEQRVLGSLLEKQVTVPASYPLTLNALRTACNQASSREPVTDSDEPTVALVGRRLKDRGLLRMVWADTGRRTLKYHQTLDEVLDLAGDERALLTVLLLRGPQAPGELKTRTDRLHAFADRTAVEETLRAMAGRGLVRELPRRGGDRDARWVHLLGAEAVAQDAPAPAPVASGAERDERVRTSYDAVATAYAEHAARERLPGSRPLERWLLDRVAEHAADPRLGGPVVEVGCGPGHVTAYLLGAGAEVTGLDLSPGMVAEARQRFPDACFEVGDLRRLMRPSSAAGWSAVVAWYSLVHLAPAELPDAVAALTRPLLPGGWLVLGLHAGSEVRQVDSLYEHEVALDFVLHEPAEVVALVEAAGLVDVEWYRRGPLVERGETTERLYLLARHR